MILLKSIHISRKEKSKFTLIYLSVYLCVYLPVYLYKETKEDKEGSNNEYDICPEERLFQNSIGVHLKI
jgi:hypothetical protein